MRPLRRRRRDGHAGRAPARPDRHAPLRGDGLQGAGAGRASRDRLRRAGARRRSAARRPLRLPGAGRRPGRAARRRWIERAVLAGASMGAHTLLRLALDQPERAPGWWSSRRPSSPARRTGPGALGRAERRACARAASTASCRLRRPAVPEAWRETVADRAAPAPGPHEHPEAVADALQQVPRSRPFAASSDLQRWTSRRWWWPTATRPIPSTRCASARPTRARSPGPARRRGAGPLADRLAGRPALEGDRRGRRGGGALGELPTDLVNG